jgi:hypothetical protein
MVGICIGDEVGRGFCLCNRSDEDTGEVAVEALHVRISFYRGNRGKRFVVVLLISLLVRGAIYMGSGLEEYR